MAKDAKTKKTPKSKSEIDKAYRMNRAQNGERKVTVWLDANTRAALARLKAQGYSSTDAAVTAAIMELAPPAAA